MSTNPPISTTLTQWTQNKIMTYDVGNPGLDLSQFTLIMCDGWFKYQDFSKYRLVWCQIVWPISWVVLFLLPSVIYTFILHSFYMNSQIALTWSIFVIYGHWPIIAYRLFHIDCKLTLYLTIMYVYCVYPAISKSPKQLPSCLKISETSVVLIVFNGVICDVFIGNTPIFILQSCNFDY
jgi:hypothetical protein